MVYYNRNACTWIGKLKGMEMQRYRNIEVWGEGGMKEGRYGKNTDLLDKAK
jgi:hypothetical protein